MIGYADWSEMREAEYGGAAFMVPRTERGELVSRMRRVGMTQQEIAETAGVSIGTVNSSLTFKNEGEDQPTKITNSRGQERSAKQTPRQRDPPSDPSPGWEGGLSTPWALPLQTL